jgi:hypothetical protein
MGPQPRRVNPPEEETIADEDGVLRESAIKPFVEKLGDNNVRAQVETAVRGAFASLSDPAPPADVIELSAQPQKASLRGSNFTEHAVMRDRRERNCFRHN